MKEYALSAAFVVVSGLTPLLAQTSGNVAMADAPVIPASSDALPDAPSASLLSPVTTPVSAGNDAGDPFPPEHPVARQYATVILPGQQAQPLHGMQKTVYALHDSVSLTAILGFTISAGWSQLIDSTPHYGTDATAFGKREGASALRSTITTMATDGLFAPMFHDDPRYYQLGDGHEFFHRAIYAASRVIITRSSHSTAQRINLPLLLGYAVTAGSNNAYYPDQDRGGRQTFENWGTSLGGAVLGFEVDEFLHDALRMVHLRRN